MTLTGLIRNFGQYTDEQLEQMRSDLSIRMPLPKLKVCASYYTKAAMRDPYIEELRFLDLFVEKAISSPSSVAPRELLTNDSFVAQTYADLIEKRRKINPNPQKPCSLQEAFGMMGNYLFRIGKTVSFQHEAYMPEELQTVPGLAESPEILSMKQVGCGLRRSFRKMLPLDQTDLLVVLAPASGLTLPETAIAFNTFLINDSCMSAVKLIHTVGEQGLLYEALRMAAGLRIDINALSGSGESDLAALVSAHKGHYLLRIAAQSYYFLAKTAKNIGLTVLPFATPDNPSSLTVTEGQQPILAWNADFIRSLYEFTPVSMRLQDESANDTSPIYQEQHSVGSCAYLSGHTTDERNTLSQYGNTVYTTAFSSPSASYFFNSIDTVLCAVMTMCASGISFSEQRLAIHLALPFALGRDDLASVAMSSILGLYRIEAELAIPMAVGKISAESERSCPALSVFGMAKGTALPDRLTAAEHRLYCVAPEYDENGLLNFEKLRAFLDWLTELSQKGILKSARMVCRKSIREALSEMETSDVVGISTDSSDSAALSLAILLETDTEINATCIGYTQTRAMAEAPVVAENEEIDRTDCLIWSPRPSVVICALPDDRDAHALAVHLTKIGAKVLLYTPKEDWRVVSSSILRSQSLILCKGAELPNRPEVDFAVETLARANGRLLCLDTEKESEKTHPFVCLKSLSAQIVDQICKNINN
ncbi:MAG: hypothetical protein IJW49_06935 [Clostridia bacterium]|nr:hypothetical protein [Clostridia bacterium]